MLRMILLAVAVLIGLGVLFVLSGYLLPRSHRAETATKISAPRTAVWALVSDMQRTPGWLSGVTKIEGAQPENGMSVWKQTDASGNTLVFITRESDPPSLLVREVRDPGGAFGGTWTIRLTDVPGGTRVAIAEDGWIAFAPFRPVQRFIIGFDTTMNRYLEDLKRAAEKGHGQ